MAEGVRRITYVVYQDGGPQAVEGYVIEEGLVRIHVNGFELATFMCTPHHLDELAIGFLRSEGFIGGIEDIRALEVCPNRSCVDVWLHDLSFRPPTVRPIVTSGCGGGVTFDDISQQHAPLSSALRLLPEQVSALMQQLYQAARFYQQARGVHTAALSDGHELLLVAEDVGRHNTIDRLWGQALKRGLATRDRVLIATGRISSEMLNKAAKMEVPIVISRTSPTSFSVQLARAWNMTVVGYVRRNSFRVYSAPHRIGDDTHRAEAPTVHVVQESGAHLLPG
ncbi:MAG: formate dehydrogenase accessory sulfurtransferase FdhD [Ardenticatenia bacterium]|nr:formate dehydrogenase accessory sulfurtransferase FdhD [Ardenticatenia bacterium]